MRRGQQTARRLGGGPVASLQRVGEHVGLDRIDRGPLPGRSTRVPGADPRVEPAADGRNRVRIRATLSFSRTVIAQDRQTFCPLLAF
jgi:hypothetical protein